MDILAFSASSLTIFYASLVGPKTLSMSDIKTPERPFSARSVIQRHAPSKRTSPVRNKKSNLTFSNVTSLKSRHIFRLKQNQCVVSLCVYSPGSQQGGVPPGGGSVPDLGPGELGGPQPPERPHRGLQAAVDREPVRKGTGQLRHCQPHGNSVTAV